VKIATYNINSTRNRLPRLIEWLAWAKPDVACLQELRIHDDEFPIRDVEAAGYRALWRGQSPRYNGVAILTLGTPAVEIRRCLPGDPGDAQARYLEAAVEGIVVACLYAPNGNPQPGPKFDYKLAWLARLAAHAKELEATGAPVVLAGDYNVVPTPADIYATTSYDDDALVQPESRAAFRVLTDQGWTDAIRHLHPRETIYTFWDYLRKRWERNAGLRIDHLLVNEVLRPRVIAAGVDREVRGAERASDHAPAWIEVEPATGRTRKS
jgi:exodeoxyribonuclease-3